MRNILITLMLCALTLIASNVFAAKYDESKRTERFGLSFYDGAPMYFVYFETDIVGSSAVPKNFRIERLRTGEDIADFSGYNKNSGFVFIPDNIHNLTHVDYTLYGFDDDGNLTLLSAQDSIGNNGWSKEMLETYGSVALAQASTGDLGLNVADELFAMAKDIFGEFFPFFAGIFALAAGSKYFEHLAKTGVKKKKNAAIVPTRATQEYFTLEKEVDQFSLTSPNANSNKDLESNERRRFLDRLAGNDVEETNSVRESYITGARWGREFSEELQESNRRLLNDFEALDDFYRERLIQEFERLSFTQEAGFLKSYRSYAYGVGDDHQNGNPFADESDFAQTPWGGSPFGGGDFEDANRLLDEEYYDSYDGAY